ncbi:MAG: hydantoinase/oxoprolinase family protein [Burkholderiaceae bacterium]
MKLVLGVDIGGTFTDVFALDPQAGRARIAKVASTPADPSRAFVEGLGAALAMQGAGFEAAATIVHGTTVGTNALLERKVARCGLITTAGFADVLEMRRRDRPSTWGLWGRFEPLIARDLRVGVRERTLANGMVREPVDADELRAAAERLLAAGCEALCVFFINSYANPANEARALECLRAVWPNEHVTASHEILPEVREFERASTASLNAALQPVVGRYVERIESSLAERGTRAELLIVQSNGGLMSVQDTRRFPIRTALSGPAAGVIACAHIATSAGWPDVITGDVGGTSFDVSLIADGRIAQTAQQSIAFGMVVRTPMIEIQTIGAGGGSLARVDVSGLLQVGPQSAGSSPGPACYGLRGHDDTLGPTVTDANVVLGRINPQRPIGALPSLDVDAARQAIARHVGEPLGLSPEAAAEAILTVANANMAGAMRLVSIERGHDPTRFAYMPFGGGGALHVCAMMREVGIRAGLIPRYPGVSSALGCAIADMRHDFVQTLNRPLSRLDGYELHEQIRRLSERGGEALAAAGVPFVRVVRRVELDMLYQGQTHTVAAELDDAAIDGPRDALGDAVVHAFEHAYRQAFGRTLAGVPMRVLNLRVAMIGERPKFDLSALAPEPADTRREPIGERRVHHDGRWWQTPVFERLALPVDFTLDGPALFEQPDTTIWLEPGFSARVDALGNLIVRTTDA